MCAGIDEAEDGLSVYDEAAREADRHKWIESQKSGHDVGVHAIRDWFRVHWRGYCRCRRLEHVSGIRHWREFDGESFGHLERSHFPGDELFNRILEFVSSGAENLEIIIWAQNTGHTLGRVLDILAVIDVNEARLEPRSV